MKRRGLFLLPFALILLASTAVSALDKCPPTEPDMLGPFYVPGAPVRSSVGKGYVLSGVVRSAQDCSSVESAQIEFWLAGRDGRYGDDYRATVFTDQKGEFTFESNYPQPYAGRPSHIHIKVTAKGFTTLITQHYPKKESKGTKIDLVLMPSK